MMHTADDYFVALEEYLRQMPEAERTETITYYREYAQEGGLLDEEQLREHFGPPEALAARILEDEAGKRTQEAPKGTGRTGVRPVAVLAGIVIAIAALGIGTFKFLHPGTAADPSVPTQSAVSSDAGTAQPDDTVTSSDTQKADEESPQSYDGTVEPFTDISVDMVAVNIRVETGDTYALRYTLRDDEVVERAGVEGQTLYLVSHKKTNRSSNEGYGEVCITVPAEACLGTMQFFIVAGGVTVPELSCDSVSVVSVSGDSTLNCMAENNVTVNSTSGDVEFGGQCQQLSVNSTSGDLTFTGKADEVVQNSTSGELDFTGTAGSIEVNSTSGSVHIQGTVTEQVRTDMVSGDILVVAADPTVTAEGDSIEYNGQRMSEDSWSRQGSGCTLTLETTSGSISINTP